MRIVFWGTPDFAVPSLRALLGEGHDVVGVVTQPDRPAGRGRELREPPVKVVAREEGIPVLQPERARGDEFMSALRELQPDLSVVAAYGQILRQELLELPARGSINVHASLLPRWRGAAPISWAIMSGDTETGVTIMRMVEKLDAGPMLFVAREPIAPEETADDLTARLSEIGAEALIEALTLLELGDLKEKPQDDAAATYAPRLTRENSHIDWSAPAEQVARQVRGLDSVPGAWCTHRGVDLKVFRPLADMEYTHEADPGTVVSVRPEDVTKALGVACGTGIVWLREVKPAGRRRMTTAEWLRGRGAAEGERLE